MIAYVDASVLLRVALGQPNALREWRDVDRGVSSTLITVEPSWGRPMPFTRPQQFCGRNSRALNW